ncbi:Nif3-like dinuclear metal center hexameric protein, partial [candidate division KSB1 bacterium]
MRLTTLTKFLNGYLAVENCPDIALNGLQVEGHADVSKVALAVDACSETFRKAASLKSDLLFTHHGIFWNRQYALTGIHADRIKTLIKNGISLYSAHLPLDIHPESGNNAGM